MFLIFSRASKFHLKVNFYIPKYLLNYYVTATEAIQSMNMYMYIFICLSRRILCKMFEKT